MTTSGPERQPTPHCHYCNATVASVRDGFGGRIANPPDLDYRTDWQSVLRANRANPSTNFFGFCKILLTTGMFTVNLDLHDAGSGHFLENDFREWGTMMFQGAEPTDGEFVLRPARWGRRPANVVGSFPMVRSPRAPRLSDRARLVSRLKSCCWPSSLGQGPEGRYFQHPGFSSRVHYVFSDSY